MSVSGTGLLWMDIFYVKYRNTPLYSDCSLTVVRSDIIFVAGLCKLMGEKHHSKLVTPICAVPCS